MMKRILLRVHAYRVVFRINRSRRLALWAALSLWSALFLGGLASPAWASIALVNTANGVDDASNTSTVASGSFAATATNLIVACGKNENSRTLTSVTDTALNAYTLLTDVGYNGGANHLRCAYAKNITGNASNVVTAHLSGNAPFKHLVVLQYSGADTAAPLDVESGVDNGTATSGTSSSFSTTATDVILLAAGANTTETFIAGNIFGSASTLEFGTGGVGADTEVEDQLNASAGTGTAAMSWSASSASGIAWASFKAAAAGGGPPKLPIVGVGASLQPDPSWLRIPSCSDGSCTVTMRFCKPDSGLQAHCIDLDSKLSVQSLPLGTRICKQSHCIELATGANALTLQPIVRAKANGLVNIFPAAPLSISLTLGE